MAFGINTITDFFKAPDGSLDQTKKEMTENLEELKKTGQLANAPTTIKSRALKGFEEDLNELGATKEEKKAAFAEFETKYNETVNSAMIREIATSPEARGIDDFVNNLEEMKTVEELKAKGDSKGGIEGFLNKYPKVKDAFLTVGSLLGWDIVKKDEVPSVLKNIYLTLKAKTEPPKPEPPASAGAEQAAETVASLTEEDRKAALKSLTDIAKLDETKLPEDITTLKLTKETLTALATNAVAAESNFSKVQKAVTEQMKDKKPTYRLSAISALQNLSEAEIANVIAAIQESKVADETKMNEMLAGITEIKTGNDAKQIRLAMKLPETLTDTAAA